MPFIESDSLVWEILAPTVNDRALNPFVWDIGKEFLIVWMRYAPATMARNLGVQMLSVKTEDKSDVRHRNEILVTSEKRDILKGIFSPSLSKLAETPYEKLQYVAHLSTAEALEVKASAKKNVLNETRNFIKNSFPNGSSKTFELRMLSNGPFMDLEWHESDLPIVHEVVEAIANPLIETQHLWNLILVLQTLVRVGPKEFSEYVSPWLLRWLEQEPSGISRFGHKNSPFSALQIEADGNASITKWIGWLAYQMRSKLGERFDLEIVKWMQRVIPHMEPNAAPIMVYLAVPIAASSEGFARANAISLCQSLLLFLWASRRTHPKSERYLAESLRYLGDFFKSEDRRLSASTSDGGKETLQVLTDSISHLMNDFSFSTDPNLREAVAKILTAMKSRVLISEMLEQALARLAKDNRARVRSAASFAPAVV